jgi:hypothetical protein
VQCTSVKGCERDTCPHEVRHGPILQKYSRYPSTDIGGSVKHGAGGPSCRSGDGFAGSREESTHYTLRSGVVV